MRFELIIALAGSGFKNHRFYVIASPSPTVILSVAKNLTLLRVNSAKQSPLPSSTEIATSLALLAMTEKEGEIATSLALLAMTEERKPRLLQHCALRNVKWRVFTNNPFLT